MGSKRYSWLFTLGATVALFIAACGGIAQQVSQKQSRHLYEQNIREGFAAKTGFEIVTIDSVPGNHLPNRAAEGLEYKETVTYPLHPQPNLGSYRMTQEKVDHIQWVTLAWKEERQKFPFVFDLYLHGDFDADDRLVVRVPDLDIRKFLHQSIFHLSDEQSLARLQAYFAEFARKAKIIYPLTLSRNNRQEESLSYEGRFLIELRQKLKQLIDGLEVADEGEIRELNQALLEIERAGSLKLDYVYRNLQLAIASSKKRENSKAQDLYKDHEAVVERLSEMAISLAVVRKISSLVIVNNCREPGIYEVEVRDGLSRPLFRANFNFDSALYDEVLSQYHGIGIREQGTGFRVSREVRGLDWKRYWNSLLPWNWLKSPPAVTIDALSIINPSITKGVTAITPLSGDIEVRKGRIPFEDYEKEVRKKSQYYYLGAEPLTYVRIDPELPPPAGFEPPHDDIHPFEYWTAVANAGKIVPHHFRTFEDLLRYEVYLSEFDLNGVYTGRSELRGFEREGEEGRWRFNYHYLKDLNHFELRRWSDGYIEIRLKSKAADGKAVNFVFGNISLGIRESEEFLFGIGEQPLISAYNENALQDRLRYGFAYGADGMILDHHRLDVGVERVNIERIDAQSYRVRLISHERIIPVWEGILRVPPNPSGLLTKG